MKWFWNLLSPDDWIPIAVFRAGWEQDNRIIERCGYTLEYSPSRRNVRLIPEGYKPLEHNLYTHTVIGYVAFWKRMARLYNKDVILQVIKAREMHIDPAPELPIPQSANPVDSAIQIIATLLEQERYEEIAKIKKALDG